MIEFVKIRTKLIELSDYSKIQSFRCNNSSIENFLKQEAYYLTIAKECSTTLVFDSDELIGFFSLKSAMIEVEVDGEIQGIPCLDIARIATSSSKQNQGYGTEILKYIFEIAHTVNERYITLEALIEHYEWYRNRGFNPLIEEEAISSNTYGLIYMMADLYDEELINQFFEE